MEIILDNFCEDRLILKWGGAQETEDMGITIVVTTEMREEGQLILILVSNRITGSCMSNIEIVFVTHTDWRIFS